MPQPIVWITGSASGLGLHLTQRFVLAGYRVLATDIDNAALKESADNLGWPKERVWLRKLDVTQKAQWLKLKADLMEKWGRLDLMLNVAGYLKPGFVHEVDMEEVDKHLNINVKGLIVGSKLAAEQMVAQGSGHIVNIASLAGIAPVPGIAIYSTTKFAVRGFSLALAQELKPLNVDVSVICPDAIETPMLALQEDYDEAALTFSGNKALTVEDVGNLVFSKVLPQRPLEVTIPRYRGVLAKLSNAFPRLAFILGKYLEKLGKEEQKKRKLAK